MNLRKTVKFLAAAFVGASVMYLIGCEEDDPSLNLSTANVRHITQDQFASEVIQSNEPVVVDCYATWCGPCRELAPVMDSVAGMYPGKIKFVKVNVDESPKVVRKYDVEGFPTILLFKNGKVVDRILGPQPVEDLKLKFDALLATK